MRRSTHRRRPPIFEPQPKHVIWTRRALLLALIACSSLAIGGGRALADGPSRLRPGEIYYDDAPVARTGLARWAADSFIQPLVRYITDCDGAGSTPDCGGPPARWRSSAVPVRVCSAQSARPSGVTSDEFRDAVSRAAATWNAQEFAAGIVYSGDCAGGDAWVFNNQQNEVGWDDARRVLAPSQAAVTRSTLPIVGGAREIREADVVLDPNLARVPRACLESTIAHEFGHLLGLGHSDDRADLMYPSFDPSAASGCKLAPSASERDRMQGLYGINRAPTISIPGGGAIEPGAVAIATAAATDPEGAPLTFEWQQLAGPTVSVISEGATARFAAPSTLGTMVTLRATAFDNYRHAASAQIVFVVGAAGAVPAIAPGLEAFKLGLDGNAELGWSESSGAASYELCSRPAWLDVPFECVPVTTPTAGVSWDTVLGASGRSDDRRLFTLAERETYLRACNAQGCSGPGTGGLTGGLRWPTWNIDYDYLAFAYDVGNLQFTIAGVVNVTGEARSFTMATGPASDPTQIRLTACGRVPSGGVCFGFLGPGARHGDYVDIVSEAPDKPTTEHRIRIR